MSWDLACFALGILLLAFVVRFGFWWWIQEAARAWYLQQAYDRVSFRSKPWYVIRYDAYHAKRPRPRRRG